MKYILIFLLCLGGWLFSNYHSALAQGTGPDCDECREAGVVVPWGGNETAYGFLPWTTSTTLNIVYKTRMCNGELHYKIIALTFDPPTTPADRFLYIHLLKNARTRLLQSTVMHLGFYGITLSEGQKIKIRTFMSSCWSSNVYPSASPYNINCYLNEEEETQKYIVPCSKACCQYEAEAINVCTAEQLGYIENGRSIVGKFDCQRERDNDICYPSYEGLPDNCIYDLCVDFVE